MSKKNYDVNERIKSALKRSGKQQRVVSKAGRIPFGKPQRKKRASFETFGITGFPEKRFKIINGKKVLLSEFKRRQRRVHSDQ